MTLEKEIIAAAGILIVGFIGYLGVLIIVSPHRFYRITRQTPKANRGYWRFDHIFSGLIAVGFCIWGIVMHVRFLLYSR